MNNTNNEQTDNNYQNQKNIISQKIQNNEPPIASNSSEPGSKPGIIKTIILAIIGILLASGFAYGAWHVYDNYFASPTLADLMLDSAEYLKKLKIYQIDYELDVELANYDSSPFSMLGSDIFSGLISDGAKQTINLKGYSYIDRSDNENIKSEGNIKLSLGAGMGQLDITNKLKDKILYFKLNDLPAVLSAFVDLNSLGSEWVSIDKNQDKGALSKYNDFFEEDEACFENGKEFARDFLKKNELYEMAKDCSTKKGESEAIINCRFKIKASVAQDLVKELSAFESEQCKTDNMKKLKDIDWEQFKEVNNDIVYDVSFSKKERYLTKLSVLYKNTQDSDNIVKDAVFELRIDDKVAQKEISAPEESAGLDEFIKILLSGFMGSMMGNSQDLLADEDSFGLDPLGSAQSKSRDAKRVADIKQIQTVLELYYNDNGAYPATAKKAVLGQGDFMVLCSDGFYSTVCAEGDYAYMNMIPANPEPGGMDYIYSCADGQNYEIIFMIENKTGFLEAGMLRASPQGIEAAGNPSLYTEFLPKDDESEAGRTSNETKIMAPELIDSDNDGLSDQEESIYSTDINNPDTDGDGYSDGDEVKNGYDPNGPGLLTQEAN